MRIDGTERRSLTASPDDDREPAWSADGQSVLFTSDRAGNEDIWTPNCWGGVDMARPETQS